MILFITVLIFFVLSPWHVVTHCTYENNEMCLETHHILRKWTNNNAELHSS